MRWWLSPEGPLRSPQFPVFWTEVVTWAQVRFLTLIHCGPPWPHQEIPEIKKALYFQCDIMDSRQISRRFSLWEKFINNDLIISPGTPRDLVSPGWSSHMSVTWQTRFYTKFLWWLWAMGSRPAFSVGPSGRDLEAQDSVSRRAVLE